MWKDWKKLAKKQLTWIFLHHLGKHAHTFLKHFVFTINIVKRQILFYCFYLSIYNAQVNLMSQYWKYMAYCAINIEFNLPKKKRYFLYAIVIHTYILLWYTKTLLKGLGCHHICYVFGVVFICILTFLGQWNKAQCKIFSKIPNWV